MIVCLPNRSQLLRQVIFGSTTRENNNKQKKNSFRNYSFSLNIKMDQACLNQMIFPVSLSSSNLTMRNFESLCGSQRTGKVILMLRVISSIKSLNKIMPVMNLKILTSFNKKVRTLRTYPRSSSAASPEHHLLLFIFHLLLLFIFKNHE